MEQTPALHRWAGRELSSGAALAIAHLLPPAALSSGMLLSGRQPWCAVQWACFQIASTLSGLQVSLFSGHPSVRLLLWVDTGRSAGLASCTGRICCSHTSTRTSSGTRPLFFPLRTLMKPSRSSSEVTQIWFSFSVICPWSLQPMKVRTHL